MKKDLSNYSFGFYVTKLPTWNKELLSKYYIKIQLGHSYREWFIGKTATGEKLEQASNRMSQYVEELDEKTSPLSPELTLSYIDYQRSNSPLIPAGKRKDWILDIAGEVKISNALQAQRELQIHSEIS